jgi:putative ABC transport system permease protein
MLKNYLSTALRNLFRSKAFALINIFGFAVGICSVILILHYVQFHTSFDNFHKEGDKIFRVSVVSERKGITGDDSHIFVPPIGPAMQRDFPDVYNYVRIRTPRPISFLYNNQSYKVDDVIYADSTFFNIFSFELITGHKSLCLANPYQIVLSKTAAEKIFGISNPIGKTINSNDGVQFTVSGVVHDSPKNSHIQFGAVISFSTLYGNPNNFMGWNGGNQYITYVKLKNGSTKQTVESKFPDFMWGYINKDLAQIGVKFKPYLQPLGEIHLKYDSDSQNIKTNIYIFSVIAGFILLLACVNFINLFTAMSSRRNREIGIRKVLGANRSDIVYQFMLESFLLIGISTVIAFIFCVFSLPLYNRWTHQDFNYLSIFDYKLFLSSGAAILLTCLLSGFYPSFVLSSFQPVQIIRKNFHNNPKGITLRSSLVVFQFAVSIALITSTLLISSQLDFIKNKELGFNKENQLIVPLNNNQLKNSYESVKNEIVDVAGVIGAAASSEIPMNGFTSNGYFPEGMTSPMMINVVDVDADYLSTYNIPIVEGRNFIKGSEVDKTSYLVNESFIKKMNWKNPLGKQVTRNGIHTIIGVVKDFHFASMHDAIAPLIITNAPWQNQFDFLTIKLKTQNLSATLEAIKNVWGKFSQDQPFNYSFLDEELDKVYRDEQIFREMFFYFSSIAIIIALMGLFGLTIFTIEKKKKEIAIRKVHGAKIFQVTTLILKQFARWILIANLFAWPITYFFIKDWLNDFAYRINISVFYFILSALITLIIAFLTIGYHTVKAAKANPVMNLKYE